MSETLIPNIIEFMAAVDPFDKLTPKTLRDVAGMITIRYFGKGEVIDLQESDQLYLLRTGAVEQRNLDGTLRARLAAEDFFGFSRLTQAETNTASDPYTITVIEDALIYCLPINALLLKLKDQPDALAHFGSHAQSRLQSGLNVVWSQHEKGLFFKPIIDVLNSQIVLVESTQTIQAVAKAMRVNANSSCAFIMQNNQFVGLITDKDMTKRVVAEGIPTTEMITAVMTENPYSVKRGDLVITAAALMMQHGIKNIPVVDNGIPIGLITPSDLVQNHRIQAIFLIDKINKIERLEQLAKLTIERQAIFEALVEAKVAIGVIGQVMAMIMDAYNRRLVVMAEVYLGAAPCEYCWIVAGSHARNEVHMLSDQDHGLILADNATEADKVYFHHLAMYVSKGMALCGYELCSGRFMAVTHKWCQPLAVWKTYYQKWAINPEYDLLLEMSVFLDSRYITGNPQLVNDLQACMCQQLVHNARVISALARNALLQKPPLSIFRNWVLVKEGENANTLDIKSAALSIIVNLVRVQYLQLIAQLFTTDGAVVYKANTEERLQLLLEHKVINEATFKDLLGAFQFISQIRYSHQLQALQQGKIPNNHINPNAFNSFERTHLRETFKLVTSYQEIMKMKFC
ncbi:hypothetical protein UA38_08735 [Photobacterium kishitanii]|uniref:CBS domain-containing protein n=3 Tax=Photobacterium kishitanii TaxID=318456 RepID=A0AAX0Z147_9GAMM|nr:DUF294 nucleotidyltransferase-like domain-containing protein [Photobacterium kishitanii]KJG57949.1 hypothetical protein UA38_08735 [Photobacterium kishitanii]PSV15800.1 CBS domain-containing protein [Photobacterium kishitanii]PSW49397.1 CBS domain-containing protein [Photobacterium kishitanii]PSX19921.1 CBS domain-containing protein [Photobacterium kishitanii]PSX29559.1 CBS domain-containing protein [Photobacterium kishitanii]